MELMPTALDATHIFDGLNEFPTHVTHMRLGSFVTNATPWPLPSIVPQSGNDERAPDSTLFQIALQWLREDREDRQELEKAGRKTRGARRGQVRKGYDH
jgi:CCR4-NOT complex subunit CAF16